MLAAAVILAAAAAFLPAAPVWITDNGNKYMIMRNFAATGSLEISHRIPEVFSTLSVQKKDTAVFIRRSFRC